MKIMNRILYIPELYPSIRFQVNTDKLISVLNNIYGFYLYDYNNYPYAIQINITNSNGNYLINYNNIHKLFNERQLIVFLSKILHNLRCNDNTLLLHGFVIGDQSNNAYVFLAPTKSGKSTLGCYLINHGYKYISDDMTILNVNDMSIIPFPRPIHLRSDSIKILEKELCIDHDSVIDNRFYVQSNPHFDSHQEFYLKHICFIKYGAEQSIKHLSSDEIFQNLILNLFSENSISTSMAHCLNISQRILGTEIKYNNMQDVLDFINILRG